METKKNYRIIKDQGNGYAYWHAVHAQTLEDLFQVLASEFKLPNGNFLGGSLAKDRNRIKKITVTQKNNEYVAILSMGSMPGWLRK